MFIFITVCNKGFHKANRISMLLKLKRTQRNLSSTNREVHSCCTLFSMVTLWINPRCTWLTLHITMPKFCDVCGPGGHSYLLSHSLSLGVLLHRKANFQFASHFHCFPNVCILISNIFYLVYSALESGLFCCVPRVTAMRRRAAGKPVCGINGAKNNYLGMQTECIKAFQHCSC